MPYDTGPAKDLAEITLEDCLTFPIWEWALDEAESGEGDETWQRPITSTRDVSADMFDPIITFQIKGTDLYGSGSYDIRKEAIFGSSIWIDNEWVPLQKIHHLPLPFVFVAIPTISGQSGVEFVCRDVKVDLAFRAVQ